MYHYNNDMWMFAVIFAAAVFGEVSSFKRGEAPSMSKSTTTSSPATAFTKSELKEHNHVWKVMNKACFGRWSGSMQVFKMDKKTNQPIFDDDDINKLLNFRLWAKADANWWLGKKDSGTWTVWNLQTLGDEFIIPLRRLPVTKPSQLKIGFHPGCVLRIPANYKQVPRAVVELGFWGDGMRRTVVLEYLNADKNKRMELKDVTIVKQRSIPYNTVFVGNATESKDIDILPQTPPFGMEDVIKRNKKWIPFRIEKVELQSMKRAVTTKNKMTNDDKQMAMKILENLEQSNGCAYSYSMVLPNGLLASFPKQMAKSSDTASKTLIFAHAWGHGRPFQALVIDFDSTTGEAIAATMYSYKS